ncbi:MAG TPA: hypothetical protein VGM29_05020, partial [Polyangiaceae bacterium]
MKKIGGYGVALALGLLACEGPPNEPSTAALSQSLIVSQELAPSDGMAFDHFCSVAVSGDLALLGAQGRAPHGALYGFARSGASWVQEGSALLPPATTTGFILGEALAISGNTAVAGGDNLAIAYTHQSGGWVQQGEPFVNPVSTGISLFGGALGLEGDTALVASPYSDTLRGRVYVFTRSGTSWSQQPDYLVG